MYLFLLRGELAAKGLQVLLDQVLDLFRRVEPLVDHVDRRIPWTSKASPLDHV